MWEHPFLLGKPVFKSNVSTDWGRSSQRCQGVWSAVAENSVHSLRKCWIQTLVSLKEVVLTANKQEPLKAGLGLLINVDIRKHTQEDSKAIAFYFFFPLLPWHGHFRLKLWCSSASSLHRGVTVSIPDEGLETNTRLFYMTNHLCWFGGLVGNFSHTPCEAEDGLLRVSLSYSAKGWLTLGLAPPRWQDAQKSVWLGSSICWQSSDRMSEAMVSYSSAE